jgi:hypothetical protein
MPVLDDYEQNGQSVVTPGLIATWKSISGWAIFLAIAGLLQACLLLAGGTRIKEIVNAMRFAYGDNDLLDSMSESETGILYFFLLAAAGLAFVYIHQLLFAIRLRRGLQAADQRVFDTSWRNLRNSFRGFGICLIVVMVCYLIFFSMLLLFLAPSS